jgi:hypothetical protein
MVNARGSAENEPGRSPARTAVKTSSTVSPADPMIVEPTASRMMSTARTPTKRSLFACMRRYWPAIFSFSSSMTTHSSLYREHEAVSACKARVEALELLEIRAVQ